MTNIIEDIEQLKRGGRLEDAKSLLLEFVESTEAENRVRSWGVAPWPYEQLAIIYRGLKDYASEVCILERFAHQKHAHGVKPAKLLERLEKSRKLLANANREGIH
jgi:hypothetical protein